MQGSRVRRPSSWPILSLLLLSLLAVSSGCKVPSSQPSAAAGSSSSSSSESQSERTRKLKEKADEIDRKAAEIQTMQGTEQEKIDAVNALDKERRELTEMQEQGK